MKKFIALIFSYILYFQSSLYAFDDFIDDIDDIFDDFIDDFFKIVGIIVMVAIAVYFVRKRVRDDNKNDIYYHKKDETQTNRIEYDKKDLIDRDK